MQIRKAAAILILVNLTAGGSLLAQGPVPLVTGRVITPTGSQTEVGSFPVNMVYTPDGKYLVVTNSGYREYLSVLNAATGALVSQLEVAGKKQGLYYGLAFGPKGAAVVRDPTSGAAPLYASRGSEQRVAEYQVKPNGELVDLSHSLSVPSGNEKHDAPTDVAGLALSSDGGTLYLADNDTGYWSNLKGKLIAVDTHTGAIQGTAITPGYPFAVAAQYGKDGSTRWVYVTSERDSVVAVVDPQIMRVDHTINTGDHPMALLFSKDQSRLYVANAHSDTISVIDTARQRVTSTIALRPTEVRGLAGATPTSMALSPDEQTLYVTLADMNAVAVVDVAKSTVRGYIPTGWYPTAVLASRDGRQLFVANAKGTAARNPNNAQVRTWGRYIENILQGTVSKITLPTDLDLHGMTLSVLANDRIAEDSLRHMREALPNTGISHVIYIIKENRTYDQVFGDIPEGNGDSSICLFPREVTPNMHALAKRFALLDNFYVCAEVSFDGWNWSTAGMASESVARNTPYNYSGRGKTYDSEGDNNGVPVDLLHLPDIAAGPGGYLWDSARKKGLSYRNYGFFVSGVGKNDLQPNGKPNAVNNAPNKRALVGHTDTDFLQFDTSYADSEAWIKWNAPFPKQMKQYGSHSSPSRFTEWKREFDEYVKTGEMPALMTVRLMRDHTNGTSVGFNTPRSMVADNDYSVGQLVDSVSHSPFWNSTAICILEDDAQGGYDHVDCHRSPALVISPYVVRGSVDHRFYNTDSMLHTMEIMLGLQPLCQYDGLADPIAVLGSTAANSEAYDAILPDRSIIAEVNGKTAYGAKTSEQLNFKVADAAPDAVLNALIWHSVKGASVPVPAVHHGLKVGVAKPDKDD